jgi:hypothetical protein
MLRGKRILVVGGVVGGVALSAGAAFAMWTANGTGSGGAKALTAQTITVTGAAGAGDLYPGFTLGDVGVTLANTNPYPVTFTSMTPGTITSSNAGACPASNLTVIPKSGLSILVPAGATNTAASITDVATMATTAPDGCQGITFTIALTLAGNQT